MNHNFNLLPDYLFVLDVSIEESIKRRYAKGDKPVLTNSDFLSLYKKELEHFYGTIKTPIQYLDTTNMTILDVNDYIYEIILNLA